MNIVKKGREWWIEGTPEYEVDGQTYTSYGPYATKAEAESDMRGVAKTWKEINAASVSNERSESVPPSGGK